LEGGVIEVNIYIFIHIGYHTSVHTQKVVHLPIIDIVGLSEEWAVYEAWYSATAFPQGCLATPQWTVISIIAGFTTILYKGMPITGLFTTRHDGKFISQTYS
jgi:hypothetical protein